MRTEELIELSDLNYAEAMREMSRRSGGAVHDQDGVLLYTGGSALPVLINGAMRTGGGLAGAAVVDRARTFFASHGRGFSILIRAHADDDLRDAAVAAGLTALGNSPAMVLDHRLDDAVPAAGVSLRRVTTRTDADAFAAVMDGAYASLGMPEGVAPQMFARLDALVAPHIVAMLARLDGVPVAGAMTVVTHGVAGVYWVGTVAEARGRGLAELCTRAVGNAGFDLGARIASLQASVMGEPVYRRMGYVEVTRYPTYVQFQAPAG